MGLGLNAVSRHRQAIRVQVLPAEYPLRLPALLLAGARIDVGQVPFLTWLVPGILAARLVAKALVAGCAALLYPPLRRAGPPLVPGLMACGPSSMAIGLAFALRFPGPVGETVLVSAAAATILGELVAPAGLRSALRRAGEATTQTGPQPAAEVAA
jgi:Kef-type K+ transport system membrane component KefB